MSFLKFHILLIITRWSHYVGRHDNLDLPNLHVLHHLHHDIDEVRYLDEVVLDHVLHITKIKWSYQRRIYKRVTVWFHYEDWHETKPNRSKQQAYHRRNHGQSCFMGAIEQYFSHFVCMLQMWPPKSYSQIKTLWTKMYRIPILFPKSVIKCINRSISEKGTRAQGELWHHWVSNKLH